MQDDCMKVPLGLPGLEILYQRFLAGDGLEMTVQYKAETAACPICGRRTAWVHATASQRKKDRRIWDRPTILVLRKRRFRCFHCHKVFSEPDSIFGFRRRSTLRLRQHVARRAAF